MVEKGVLLIFKTGLRPGIEAYKIRCKHRINVMKTAMFSVNFSRMSNLNYTFNPQRN